MKVVSTEALTKLIQLVKSAFIKVEDVVETSEVTLADVATSGDYDDLINKPTIPSEVTESTVSGWGFTKNTGTVTSVNNVSPVNGNVTLSIPTVNNASLIIQKNGTNVATFTANASSNVTANISVPNTVSSVSSSSTNADAVGAKLFYDTVGDIETALHTINSGGIVTVSIFAFGERISNATVTIGDETFTNLVAGTTYTFEANKNESYILRFQCSGYAVAIQDSNGNVLVGYPNTYLDDVSYTFTATSDVTYRVYASSEIF